MASFWPFRSSPPGGRGPNPSQADDDDFYEANESQPGLNGNPSQASQFLASQHTPRPQQHHMGSQPVASSHVPSHFTPQARGSQYTPLSYPKGSQTGPFSASRAATLTPPVGLTRQIGSIIVEPPDPNSSRPVPFVYRDKDGAFKMDKEAELVLRGLKGPLGVVAVCGRARQGKSFILNQLLGQSSGFEVGPTHRPCTKGLWIWSSAIRCTAPDGFTYHLLLLDSEGIDATDQTGKYSTEIFSLAVLLSSLFLFNQMGGIDEAALDKLSLVTQMTSHIRVRSGGDGATASGASGGTGPGLKTPQSAAKQMWGTRPSGASSGASTASAEAARDLGMFSPVFFWVLRDFFLQLNDEGRKITPKEYLEEALQLVPGTSEAEIVKNEIRESIRALFPERDCFALVRPVNEEDDLQRLNQIPLHLMRPQFRESLNKLVQAVFEKGRPKRVGDAVMTGPILAGITEAYLNSINSGAVPVILNAWKNVEEHECQRAFEAALATYGKEMAAQAATDEADLRQQHSSALRTAMSKFEEEAVGTGAIRRSAEEKLLQEAEQRFQDRLSQLVAESELKCTAALQSIDTQLRAKARAQPTPSISDLAQSLEAAVAQYEAQATGPAKWKSLAAFLRASVGGLLQDHGAQLVAQARAEAAAAHQSLATLEQRLQAAEAERERAREDVKMWHERHDKVEGQVALALERMGNAEKDVLQLKGQLDAAKLEASVAQRDTVAAQKELARLRQDWDRTQEALLTQQERSTEASKRAIAAEQQAQHWQQRHQEEVARGESAASAWEKERRERDAAAEALKESYQRQIAAKVGDKDAEVGRLNVELQAAKDAEARLQKRLQDHVEDLKAAERKAADLNELLLQKESALKHAQAASAAAADEVKSVDKEKGVLNAALHNANHRVRQVQQEKDAAEVEARRQAELAVQATRKAEEAERALASMAKDSRSHQEAMQAALIRADAAESQVRELQLQLQDLRLRAEESEGGEKRRAASLQGELAAARERAGKLQEELAQRVEDLRKAGKGAAQWAAEKERLVAQAAQWESDAGQLADELASAKAEAAARAKEASAAAAGKSAAEEEVSRLKAVIQSFKGKGAAPDGGAAVHDVTPGPAAKRKRVAEPEAPQPEAPQADAAEAEADDEDAEFKSVDGDGDAMDDTPADTGPDSVNLDFDVGSPYNFSPAASTPKGRGRGGQAKGKAKGRGRGRGGQTPQGGAAAPGAIAKDDPRMVEAMKLTKAQLKEALVDGGFGDKFVSFKEVSKPFLAELYAVHILKA